jgi:prepilin-type N-terminal cleavage/methylation domain-containing protein
MRSPSGFTLIEMMIVIVIAGATASVVAPTVRHGVARTRVQRAASVVAGDLELAFSQAARQRKPIRVTFDSSTLSYTVADRASGTVLFSRAFGPNSDLALGSVTASASTLDIYPNGIASGPDTVRLQLDGQARRVTVTRVGVIRGLQ